METFGAFLSATEHAYPNHPESPARLRLFDRNPAGVEWLTPKPASLEQVGRVHNAEMLNNLQEVCTRNTPAIIDHAPTYVTATSYQDALLAAGGTIACTLSVLRAEARNAFAVVRPPGHHAEPDKSMGFCLLNNIAIAALEALNQGQRRVLIVDFDAHHGNGTQAAFWDDSRVAFLSSHQEGIYPGGGHLTEAPHARARIVNAPLPAFSGDEAFSQLVDFLYPALARVFRPELILVSAGFDAHWKDPLTSLGLSSVGYYALSQKLVNLAEEFCGGKIVFVLEGGYDPQSVAEGAEAVFSALTGRGWSGKSDISPHPEPDITSRLESIRKWHGL